MCGTGTILVPSFDASSIFPGRQSHASCGVMLCLSRWRRTVALVPSWFVDNVYINLFFSTLFACGECCAGRHGYLRGAADDRHHLPQPELARLRFACAIVRSSAFVACFCSSFYGTVYGTVTAERNDEDEEASECREIPRPSPGKKRDEGFVREKPMMGEG